MNTLNKEASKAVDDLGVEVLSENHLFWAVPRGGSNYELLSGGTPYQTISGSYTALNLQELILVLPAIGEKLGWKEWMTDKLPCCPTCHGKYSHMRTETAMCHHLLDIFLTDGMEGVSQEIIKLIEEK